MLTGFELKKELYRIIDSEINMSLTSFLCREGLSFAEAEDTVKMLLPEDRAKMISDALRWTPGSLPTMLDLEKSVVATDFDSYSSVSALRKKIKGHMLDTCPRERFFLAFEAFFSGD